MPSPTNPRLGLPRSVASLTYLVIAETILEHPTIKRVIKTYNVPGLRFELAREAMTPDWVPTAAQSPSLWLWPSPRDGQPGTNANQNATLNVDIGIYVLSPDPTDAMDLWGLIEEAVNPRSVGMGLDLAASLGGVSRWGPVTLHQPGSVVLESDAGIVTLLRGSVSTGYRIQGFGG